MNVRLALKGYIQLAWRIDSIHEYLTQGVIDDDRVASQETAVRDEEVRDVLCLGAIGTFRES